MAHQEQTDLKPYPAEESKEDKVQYPTLGKPKHMQAQKDPEPEDENVVQYPTIGRAKPKVSFPFCVCLFKLTFIFNTAQHNQTDSAACACIRPVQTCSQI